MLGEFKRIRTNCKPQKNSFLLRCFYSGNFPEKKLLPSSLFMALMKRAVLTVREVLYLREVLYVSSVRFCFAFIHAFNKSGRHLEFLIYDIIRGKTSTAIFEF